MFKLDLKTSSRPLPRKTAAKHTINQKKKHISLLSWAVLVCTPYVAEPSHFCLAVDLIDISRFLMGGRGSGRPKTMKAIKVKAGRGRPKTMKAIKDKARRPMGRPPNMDKLTPYMESKLRKLSYGKTEAKDFLCKRRAGDKCSGAFGPCSCEPLSYDDYNMYILLLEQHVNYVRARFERLFGHKPNVPHQHVQPIWSEIPCTCCPHPRTNKSVAPEMLVTKTAEVQTKAEEIYLEGYDGSKISYLQYINHVAKDSNSVIKHLGFLHPVALKPTKPLPLENNENLFQDFGTARYVQYTWQLQLHS